MLGRMPKPHAEKQHVASLRRLLRGLNGSLAQAVATGGQIVLLDDRIISVALTPEEIGQALVWQAGTGATQVFTFNPASV